ncbi:hypothetical protein ACTXT7_009684 [Hymenolepis weldensis]
MKICDPMRVRWQESALLHTLQAHRMHIHNELFIFLRHHQHHHQLTLRTNNAQLTTCLRRQRRQPIEFTNPPFARSLDFGIAALGIILLPTMIELRLNHIR